MPIGPTAIKRANYQCFQTRKMLRALVGKIDDDQKDVFNRLDDDLERSLSELDSFHPQFVTRDMIKQAEMRIAAAVEFIKSFELVT